MFIFGIERKFGDDAEAPQGLIFIWIFTTFVYGSSGLPVENRPEESNHDEEIEVQTACLQGIRNRL